MLKLMKIWLKDNGLLLNDEQLMTETQDERRGRLLKITAVFCLIFGTLATLIFLYMFLLNSAPSNTLISAFASAMQVVSGLGVLWLIRHQKINLAAWLQILSLYGVVSGFCFSVGTVQQPTLVSYFFCILLAWAVLNTLQAVIVIGLCLVGVLFMSLAEVVFKFLIPQTVNDPTMAGINLAFGWVNSFFLVSLLLGLLISSFNRVSVLSKRQNQTLKLALAHLQEQQQVGQNFSQQVLTTASQLSNSAVKQSSGSQQQAIAITQVNTGLDELTHTANVIAQSVQRVAAAMEQMVKGASLVESTTDRANLTGQAGQQALIEATLASRQVGQLYDQLVTTLTGLYERANSVQNVVSLINGLGSESHLLALNAAIEASSAGEQGERFGVIAQEIKSLADKTRRAGTEVRQMVEEIQAEISEAVNTAHSGNQVALQSIQTTQVGEQVINQLAQVVKQALIESQTIVGQARHVLQASEEIEQATQQQHSAGQQILITLREVNQVAQENAGDSQQVRLTAHQLENMAHQLRSALLVQTN